MHCHRIPGAHRPVGRSDSPEGWRHRATTARGLYGAHATAHDILRHAHNGLVAAAMAPEEVVDISRVIGVALGERLTSELVAGVTQGEVADADEEPSQADGLRAEVLQSLLAIKQMLACR